jgi:prepilin-type N-terminal cleavage/methylation domain-containing protein
MPAASEDIRVTFRKGVRRAGFTLMEVAVAAVLIAVLAAATIPTLSEFMRTREAIATAKTLSELGEGIAAFKNAVLTSNSATSNTYPRFISSLSNAITASNRNSCWATFNATAVTNWAATGPFVSFNIPPGGLFTPLGVVQDSMLRTPNTANPGTLAIRMTVDSVDALRLDQVIDGGDGANAGTLRVVSWVSFGTLARTAEVQYLVPVAAKC